MVVSSCKAVCERPELFYNDGGIYTVLTGGTMLVLVCAEIGKKPFLTLSTKLENYNNKTYAQCKWGSNAVFGVEILAVGDKCESVHTSAL